MIQRRIKIIATTSILLFLVSTLTFLLFLSIVIKQKNNFIEHRTQRAEQLSKNESLKALLLTLEETKDDRESLSTRILEEEEFINFITLIETIGKEQGTVLTTNSLMVAPVNEIYEKIVMNIKVVGSYESVTNMLTLLEHLPYQSTLSKVQLSKSEGETGQVWTGVFEIEITKYKKV